MILNVSRAKQYMLCPHKAFNQHHRKVEGPRSMNLTDGGAFHRGVAVGRASKDWTLASTEAHKQFDEDLLKSTIPPEQLYLIDDHWALVSKMIECFQTQYEHELYQIIQPEVEFEVALPESMHNCIFMHWLDSFDYSNHYGEPPWEMILAHRVISPHLYPDSGCRCYQPHRIVGKTDAVVSWNNNIWLDEYKTTSIQGEQFWDQWQMDIQPTVYIYGIWKQMKVRPRGFLLNSIFKPSEAQVSNWNSKRKNGPSKPVTDYIKYSREAFLRTEEDLMRVERVMYEICLDWEEQVMSGTERMLKRTPFQVRQMSHTCMSYNRKCDYWSACNSHDAPGEFDGLARKQLDYVEEKYIQLIGDNL